MKRPASVVSIGIVLICTAGAAHSDPVEYTFTTTSPIVIAPELTAVGLTSASGSFVYDSSAPLAAELNPDVGFYHPWHSISGTIDGGVTFDSYRGGAFVFNGSYIFDTDFFWLPALVEDTTLAGFNLRQVAFTWAEIVSGDNFIDSIQLPTLLPPTTGGRMSMIFMDADNNSYSAQFEASVVAGAAASNPTLSYGGQLDVIYTDAGMGGIYSGYPLGSEFSGSIDLITGLSTISDGTTERQYTSFFEQIRPGNWAFYEFDNDFVLDEEAGYYIDALPGVDLGVGDVIDYVATFGELPNSVGGRIEFGVQFILDPAAFGAEGPATYPPDPEHLLFQVFSIEERDAMDVIFYDAAGFVDSGTYAGPIELVGDLLETIAEINQEADIPNSLDAKFSSIAKAVQDANSANDVAVLNGVNALCNEVSAQRGKKLTDEQADRIVAGANLVIASLDPGAPLCE